MVNLLPAIIIGGPPHAGKSVLFRASPEFNEQGVAHHAIRACPDGEGNWSQETDQEMVRLIRIKGHWTDEFLEGICRDLERRHLPLLVDMGGRPMDCKYIFCNTAHIPCYSFVPMKKIMHNFGVNLSRKMVFCPWPSLYSEREGIAQPDFQRPAY